MSFLSYTISKTSRAKACFYTLLIAVVLNFATVSTALAKDKWINLHTKNFNIVSNADEGNTRQLARKLEQFHFIFSKIIQTPVKASIPVTVVVFKSDGSFKPFKPLYNGKPANVAGYFVPAEDENLIALDITNNQQHPMATIFHEYTHLL